jgi:Predicted SAM-dependent methyltransferases
MDAAKQQMFINRLSKVYKHVGKLARKQQVSCYRVYDHDLPEFPLCIEFYGDNLYIAEYKRNHGMTDEAHDDWMEACIETICSVLSVQKENVFLKLRQRKPGRLGQYQKVDAQQHDPIAIGFAVSENGLQFIVNLSDYLDTGLFLDHRLTRQMVREQCAGKKGVEPVCLHRLV